MLVFKPCSHMSPMIGESLSVTIQGENSQRILLMSSHKQWPSPMSATYENQALQKIIIYSRVRQYQLVKCKFLIQKYFYFTRYMHFHVHILEYHNSDQSSTLR